MARDCQLEQIAGGAIAIDFAVKASGAAAQWTGVAGLPAIDPGTFHEFCFPGIDAELGSFFFV